MPIRVKPTLILLHSKYLPTCILFSITFCRGGTAKRLKLKAQFLIDGHTDQSLTFVDDEVRLPHFDDCEFARKEDQVGNIALGCIVTIIVLCVIGLVGLWFFRPRKGLYVFPILSEKYGSICYSIKPKLDIGLFVDLAEFSCFYQFLHDVIIKLFRRSKQNNYFVTTCEIW